MSGINGDKSRFNRLRKQKIARRLRNREMMESLTEQKPPAGAHSGDKRQKVVA